MISLDNPKSNNIRDLYKLDADIDLFDTEFNSRKQEITHLENIENSSKYKLYQNASKVTSFISSVLESTIVLSIFALIFDNISSYFKESVADVTRAKENAEDRITVIKQNIDNNIKKIDEITGPLCETMFHNAFQMGYHFDESRGFVPNTETQTKPTAQNQFDIYQKELTLFKQYLEHLTLFTRILKLDELDSKLNEVIFEKYKDSLQAQEQVPQEKPKASLKERAVALGSLINLGFGIFFKEVLKV
jgi:hypothetical protein